MTVFANQQDRIMLQPSVIPAGLLLLLSLGIGGLSIAMVPLVPLAGIGGLFLSGFGIKCCYSRLLPGATWLSIDPDGFSLCQNFRVQTFSWHEVDHFTIQSNQNDEGSTLPILLMHPINQETPIHIPAYFGKRLDEMLELLSSRHQRSTEMMLKLERFEQTLKNN